MHNQKLLSFLRMGNIGAPADDLKDQIMVNQVDRIIIDAGELK